MRIGFGEAFDRYRPLSLHRIQFNELAARLFYKVYLMEKVPFYVIAEQPDMFVVHQQPFYPRFRPWENGEYARLFARMSDIQIDKLYFESDDAFMTFLDDDEGNPKAWPDASVPMPVGAAHRVIGGGCRRGRRRPRVGGNNEESCIWRAVAQATPHLRPSPALQIQSR
jgi:hypothetical protein